MLVPRTGEVDYKTSYLGLMKVTFAHNAARFVMLA